MSKTDNLFTATYSPETETLIQESRRLFRITVKTSEAYEHNPNAETYKKWRAAQEQSMNAAHLALTAILEEIGE